MRFFAMNRQRAKAVCVGPSSQIHSQGMMIHKSWRHCGLLPISRLNRQVATSLRCSDFLRIFDESVPGGVPTSENTLPALFTTRLLTQRFTKPCPMERLGMLRRSEEHTSELQSQ